MTIRQIRYKLKKDGLYLRRCGKDGYGTQLYNVLDEFGDVTHSQVYLDSIANWYGGEYREEN